MSCEKLANGHKIQWNLAKFKIYSWFDLSFQINPITRKSIKSFKLFASNFWSLCTFNFSFVAWKFEFSRYFWPKSAFSRVNCISYFDSAWHNLSQICIPHLHLAMFRWNIHYKTMLSQKNLCNAFLKTHFGVTPKITPCNPLEQVFLISQANVSENEQKFYCKLHSVAKMTLIFLALHSVRFHPFFVQNHKMRTRIFQRFQQQKYINL